MMADVGRDTPCRALLLPILVAGSISASCVCHVIALRQFRDRRHGMITVVLACSRHWGSLTFVLTDGTTRRVILPTNLLYSRHIRRRLCLIWTRRQSRSYSCRKQPNPKCARLCGPMTHRGRVAHTPPYRAQEPVVGPIGRGGFYGATDGWKLRSSFPRICQLRGKLAFPTKKQQDLASLRRAEGYTNHRIGGRGNRWRESAPVVRSPIDPCGRCHGTAHRPHDVPCTLNGKALSPHSFSAPFTAKKCGSRPRPARLTHVRHRPNFQMVGKFLGSGAKAPG